MCIVRLITAFVILLLLSSCTDNQRARRLGGTQVVKVEADKKLVNVTWKDTSLWILTRARIAGEAPVKYEFVEIAPFGLLQGKVIIEEN